ncbi:MAG: type II toxin-antitoxin system VapC family toxin [Candidatus Altiarchaeota archaeon]|nr:type II toxin-antitoxin system VapC family toxin [Candidatus Altiarchaeota archaeon]
MNDCTLDTTVLAKGIIPPRRRKNDSIHQEQYRLHKIARSMILKVEEGKTIMNVPSAALVEIAAVAARLTGKEGRGMQAADYVRKHGNIIYDYYILDKAVKIAAKTKISGFDAVYIACAKTTRTTLVTDDKGMYEAAISAGINARLLRDMT